MRPIDNLNIDRETYKKPDYLFNDSRIHEYSKYSTECVGNHKRVKSLIRKIKRAVKAGKTVLPDFFVGLGNSGMGLASVLSYEFNRPLIHIRKGSIHRREENVKAVSLNRIGYLNTLVREEWPGDKAVEAWTKETGHDWSPLLNKTFWFVDDCLDSGLTYQQVIHLCSYEKGMVCSGVALTWFTWKDKRTLKRWALLKQKAPFTVFKIGNVYAY